MERVVLARHGESVLGAQGLANGDPAVENGLTRAGEAQAQALGAALAEVPLELGVATELPRTQQTLALAVAEREVPTLVLGDLNEIRFGRWEGGPFRDYLDWAWSHGPEEPCPGGGETRAEAVRRIGRGFRTILERPERTVLVVGHGLLRYLLTAVEGRDPQAVLDPVPLAEPIPLAADEVRVAVERLERWCERPVFA